MFMTLISFYLYLVLIFIFIKIKYSQQQFIIAWPAIYVDRNYCQTDWENFESAASQNRISFRIYRFHIMKDDFLASILSC